MDGAKILVIHDLNPWNDMPTDELNFRYKLLCEIDANALECRWMRAEIHYRDCIEQEARQLTFDDESPA